MKNKQKRIMIIGMLFLVIGFIGITYSFFNYTRTGTNNVIKVGRIAFSSNQTNTIGLTNVFPISSIEAETDTDNTDEVVINITGDTTYSGGIEYKLTATNVNNTISNRSVPISIIVNTSNGLGNADASYFDNRGNINSIYKVLAGDVIENDGDILVGYIKNGADGIDGTITIKAYIDKDKVAISDTYPEGGVDTNNDNEIDYTNGTTSTWVGDRVVLTTAEWNTLQTTGISFKVRVEANEGIWIDGPIPTIASCPGCKFIYTENYYTFGENGSTLTDIATNNEELLENYNTVINESGHNVFLGVIVNETTNKIEKGYACGIKGEEPNSGVPFCIEAALDNNHGGTIEERNAIFTANSIVLNDAINGIWQNTCEIEDLTGDLFCDGNVYAISYVSGTVNVDITEQLYDYYCNASEEGQLHCSGS